MPPRSPAARPPQDAALPVLRKFRQVFNAIKAHFRDVEAKTGVAGAQVWALSVVAGQPGIGVSALAVAMDVHQSTASNLLKPLVAQGLVTSTRDEEDRRVLRLRITASGRAVLRKAPAPASGLLPDALSRLDDATLARLSRDLDALLKVVKADKRGARMPIGSAD